MRTRVRLAVDRLDVLKGAVQQVTDVVGDDGERVVSAGCGTGTGYGELDSLNDR